MTTLLFTAEGGLHADRHDRRLPEHAGLLEYATPTAVESRDGRMRLLAGEAEYEIVPLGPSGWAFELRDESGSCSGGFRPFRLRRGGRLRVGEVGLALHGQPWSHEEWQFSTYDGRSLAATAPPPPRNAAADSATGADVALEMKPVESPADLLEVLALGCWLISRWRSLPTVDHLLCSAASAGGIAAQRRKGPLRGTAAAGILAQPAN
jgi:hypothetical protein